MKYYEYVGHDWNGAIYVKRGMNEQEMYEEIKRTLIQQSKRKEGK
jgi:hypothetical protein